MEYSRCIPVRFRVLRLSDVRINSPCLILTFLKWVPFVPVVPMKLLLACFIAASLAVPAADVIQLCKHQSGDVHFFAESFCDGTVSHEDGHIDHGPHGHKHPEDHSHNTESGEHHEPCSHETVDTQVDLKAPGSKLDFSTDQSSAALFVYGEESSRKRLRARFSGKVPKWRVPPGLDDVRREFTSCIRLTA